jgi:hypothetical protein
VVSRQWNITRSVCSVFAQGAETVALLAGLFLVEGPDDLGRSRRQSGSPRGPLCRGRAGGRRFLLMPEIPGLIDHGVESGSFPDRREWCCRRRGKVAKSSPWRRRLVRAVRPRRNHHRGGSPPCRFAAAYGEAADQSFDQNCLVAEVLPIDPLALLSAGVPQWPNGHHRWSPG